MNRIKLFLLSAVLLSQISCATGISPSLPAVIPTPKGGTGLSSCGGVGKVLSCNGTVWTTVSAPEPALPWTTAGDLIVRDNANVPARLPGGAVGTVLTGNGVGVQPTFQSSTSGVLGPASSTNDALAWWDGTTGRLLKDSVITRTANGGLMVPTGGSAAAASLAVGAANSGFRIAGSSFTLAYSGVDIFYAQLLSSQVAFQLGTSAATLYGGANGGGLGYYITTLIPFKNYYMGDGVLGLGVTSGATSQYSTKALIDAQSTTKGVLFPRMTTTQKNAITTPGEGLIVYDLTLHKLCVYTGSAWETITSL